MTVLSNKLCKSCNCELFVDEINLIDNQAYCDNCTEICVICEKARLISDIEIMDVVKGDKVYPLQVVCKDCRQ